MHNHHSLALVLFHNHDSPESRPSTGPPLLRNFVLVISLLFPQDRKTLKTRFIQIAVVAARVGRQGRWQLPIGQSGDAVELGAGMTPLSICIPTPEQLGKSCDSVEGIGAGSWKSRWRVAAKLPSTGQPADRQTMSSTLFIIIIFCSCFVFYALVPGFMHRIFYSACHYLVPPLLSRLCHKPTPSPFLQGRPTANPQQSLS